MKIEYSQTKVAVRARKEREWYKKKTGKTYRNARQAKKIRARQKRYYRQLKKDKVKYKELCEKRKIWALARNEISLLKQQIRMLEDFLGIYVDEGSFVF